VRNSLQCGPYGAKSKCRSIRQHAVHASNALSASPSFRGPVAITLPWRPSCFFRSRPFHTFSCRLEFRSPEGRSGTAILMASLSLPLSTLVLLATISSSGGLNSTNLNKHHAGHSRSSFSSTSICVTQSSRSNKPLA
jgi:hypothetical protein